MNVVPAVPVDPSRSARPRKWGQRLRDDRGAALLEFGLLFPFLAVMILGTIDVGRAFSLRNRLTNMAREGAILAQYFPYNTGSSCSPSIPSRAQAEDPELTGTTVTVSVNGATVVPACGAVAPAGTRVKVTVTKPLTVVTPFLGAASGSSIMSSGSIEVVTQG